MRVSSADTIAKEESKSQMKITEPKVKKLLLTSEFLFLRKTRAEKNKIKIEDKRCDKK